MTQTIDAAAFQQMVIHAAAAISAQKQHINDLNVFPVPDGDTGTNMSLTISAAAAELKKKQCATVGEAAQTAASALLRGARGNSGVILSLLFRGIAKSLKDRETIDGRDLAIALDFGVAAAYKAVMKPAEGTILTDPAWLPLRPPPPPGRRTRRSPCWRPPFGRGRKPWPTPSTRTRC